MKTKNVPSHTSEDLAAERLVAAVESGIGVIQARLTNLDGDRDAKWSVSDLVRLLRLRKQLQGERPRTVVAYWVDRRDGDNDYDPGDNQPETDTQVGPSIEVPPPSIDSHPLYRSNQRTRK